MSVTCECGKEHPDWVPKERLSKVAQQRKEADAARDEAVAKVDELTGQLEAASNLTEQVAQLTAERDKLTARAAIMQAGITDPEGIEVVEALWAARPEDARPPEGLTGWLTSPDDLPRAVRAYLPQDPPAAPPSPPEGGAPSAASEGGVPPSTPPAPPAGYRPPGVQGVRPGQPSTAAKLTAEQIRGLSPAEYKAWRDGGGVQAHKGVG